MPDATTAAIPASFEEVVTRVGAALRQSPRRTAAGVSFRLPEAVPGDLDADLFFVFPEHRDLDLRLRFDGCDAMLEPGRGDARDSVRGSVRAFLDFFENRRSSQALFLEADWQMGDGAGRGAGDLADIASYLRALETVLPEPYELTAETRRRVAESAARMAPGFTVDRRDATSVDEFRDRFVRTGRPVILRGATGEPGWWTFDTLRLLLGDVHTHLSRYPDCSYSIECCIHRIVSGAPEAFKAALPVTRAIRDRHRHPEYFPPDAVFEKAQALLVAPADARMPSTYRATSWHRDWADNLLSQLIGLKRVRLASPVVESRFSLRTTAACHYNVAVDHSAIDPRQPLEDVGVSLCDVILEPGDLLFIPCGWLHTVENLTPTAAINCWRVRPPEMLSLQG